MQCCVCFGLSVNRGCGVRVAEVRLPRKVIVRTESEVRQTEHRVAYMGIFH